MALPASGQITLFNIRDEFGGSGQTNLKQWYGKGGAPSSGQITIKDFYGLSASEYVYGYDNFGGNYFDGGSYSYYYTEVYYSFYADGSLGYNIYQWYGLDNWGSLSDGTYWYWDLVNSYGAYDMLNGYSQMRVTSSDNIGSVWQNNGSQWGPDDYFGTSGTIMWDQSPDPTGYLWAVYTTSATTDMKMEFR